MYYILQIFIDRDPVFFSKILNYLRTKEIDLRFVFRFADVFSFAINLNKCFCYVSRQCSDSGA